MFQFQEILLKKEIQSLLDKIKEKHKNQGNDLSLVLDLSGNNDECEKVFAYLKKSMSQYPAVLSPHRKSDRFF